MWMLLGGRRKNLEQQGFSLGRKKPVCFWVGWVAPPPPPQKKMMIMVLLLQQEENFQFAKIAKEIPYPKSSFFFLIRIRWRCGKMEKGRKVLDRLHHPLYCFFFPSSHTHTHTHLSSRTSFCHSQQQQQQQKQQQPQ